MRVTGVTGRVRNVGIYLIGVAMAVVGALGLSEAIELHFSSAVVLFAVGLVLVIAVHEYLDGPI